MAAYADDLLFFFTNPRTSLPSLLKEFSLFGSISNLKINFSKSKVMNISIPTDTINSIKHICPFKWVDSAIKYLGIWLNPTLSKLCERNFIPLLKMITTDLRSWHPRHFSWFGRAAICKMIILPRVLYLLRNIPIKIPQTFFKVLHSTQMTFIWAHKCPRVKFALLTQSKEKRGMSIPDYKKYYYAFHITRIIDWHCHYKFKDRVDLEDAICPIHTILTLDPMEELPSGFKVASHHWYHSATSLHI